MWEKKWKYIGKVLEYHTGHTFCRSGVLKSLNVNMVVGAFGSDTFLDKNGGRGASRRLLTPCTLQYLSKQVLPSGSYSQVCLQVLLENVIHKYAKREWINNCTVDRYGYISTFVNEKGETVGAVIKYFSYPEYSTECGEIEHCTLDFTHILTNMRIHILS